MDVRSPFSMWKQAYQFTIWSLQCIDRKAVGYQKRGDAMGKCCIQYSTVLRSKLETGTLQPRRLQGTRTRGISSTHNLCTEAVTMLVDDDDDDDEEAG